MNIVRTSLSLAIAAGIMLAAGCGEDNPSDTNAIEVSTLSNDKDITIWPKIKSEVKEDAELEAKITALMSKMTLAQKVAQMMQPEIRDITVEDMRKYGFGSYLNGGGAFPNNNKHSTPADWIALAEAMYQASVDDSEDGIRIPTMWGTDAVHGHNNVIGATLFPHNIGLGAANNPELIEKIAQVTATEVMVTGIDWVFAPTVATVRDDRWGRTYEGYSEDPEIVKAYAASIVKGLQGHADKDFLGDDRVISTVKHWLGDGGTENGDDQGNNIASEQDLFNIHAQGYVGGLTAGAQSVMASFNSWHGEKIHGSPYLLTDVLKDRMGFDGFVVGDWNGHGQINGCTNESCPQAANAGLDMYMVPTGAWKPLLENTIAQAEQGIIPMSRIDDAVRRILRVKFRAGLFDKPSPANRQFSGKTELIGSKAHRDVAKQAVRESLVLLKNKNNILPLAGNAKVLVAGDGADNIGKQSGGWTITWQGTGNVNSDFPGGTSILDGIETQVNGSGGQVEFAIDGEYKQKPDVAIVVFGEEPYAEGNGDIDNLEYQRGAKKDLALLKKLKSQGIPVVSIFISGRPLWVNPELNASDAFVAAWLPGSEGSAVAEVLFKDANDKVQYDFTGALSFSWPQSPSQAVVNRFDADYQPLLPYGFGLRYGQENVLSDDLNETVVENNEQVADVKLIERGVVAPWLAQLSDDSNTIGINSNTATLPAVSYRTIDRFVQEDSFNLTFNGAGNASYIVVTPFSEDLRAFSVPSANLLIEWQVESFGGQDVMLTINDTSLNLKDYLVSMAKSEWQQVAIPMSCFIEKGLTLGQVTVAAKLSTAGPLNLSLHKLSYSLSVPEEVEVVCP